MFHVSYILYHFEMLCQNVALLCIDGTADNLPCKHFRPAEERLLVLTIVYNALITFFNHAKLLYLSYTEAFLRALADQNKWGTHKNIHVSQQRHLA